MKTRGHPTATAAAAAWRTASARWSAAGALLLLAACATPPPKPTVLDGTIRAAASVNPSTSQRPSPLLLRVYELKSAAAFNGADFMALYQRDQAELAADLVAKEEFVLAPGESRKFSKTLAPQTRFVAVLAAYRDLEHAQWRSVVAVPPKPLHKLLIQADALAVEARLEP